MLLVFKQPVSKFADTCLHNQPALYSRCRLLQNLKTCLQMHWNRIFRHQMANQQHQRSPQSSTFTVNNPCHPLWQ